MCVYNTCNRQLFDSFIEKLKEKYTLKVEYQPKDFLSLEIEYHKGYLKLHQTGYIEQMLKDFKMVDCNPTDTPITPAQVKSITETPASLKILKDVNDFPMLTLWQITLAGETVSLRHSLSNQLSLQIHGSS